MKEKLIEYLDELHSRDSKHEIEWMFGAIMGAYVMGVITMREKNELMHRYCGLKLR